MTKMDARRRILLVDDDQDLLRMYQEILSRLPTRPEVRTATTGARALAMIDNEPFRVLICDLKMPKLDGLQILSIVRRKYPELRTVALTSMDDEQFRSRAYALGVDQFWRKPATEQEIELFQECIESLLGRESESGFRGVQSKSLVDIIQLECISQSSSVLRIVNGPLSARIWIQDGEMIDAECEELRGEEAVMKILRWRTGAFEMMPGEPSRPRTIFKSYNAVLLDSAYAQDESQLQEGASPAAIDPSLGKLGAIEGMEFLLAMRPGADSPEVARGLENPRLVARWARQSLERFRAFSERLQAGPLGRLQGLGPQRNVAITAQGGLEFCIGWKHSMDADQIETNMKKATALWAS